jgi:hypothetical protein
MRSDVRADKLQICFDLVDTGIQKRINRRGYTKEDIQKRTYKRGCTKEDIQKRIDRRGYRYT